MLSIGPGFSPDHRSGLVKYGLAVAINRFSVTLHIPLLKVGCKTMEILIIRKYGFALRIKKIVVSDLRTIGSKRSLKKRRAA